MRRNNTMRTGNAAIRLLAGLALALALAAAIVPLGGGRAQAQENGLASITLYTAACPPGFTGDVGECYDNAAANVGYTLTGGNLQNPLAATSQANGFTAFEGLNQAGQY